MTGTLVGSPSGPFGASDTAAHQGGGADAQRTDRAASALTIYAFLWAFASLFHQAAYPSAAVGLSVLLIGLPAVAVLLFPHSVALLLAGMVLQLAQVSRSGIAVHSNHWVFMAALNVAMIAGALRLAARARSLRIDRGALFQEFAPVARILIVVLYAFAVLHKLNRDFLFPATSCATDHYARISSFFGFLPQGQWVDWAVIVGTLAIEAAIPVLLVIRRTRIIGCLVAGAFHFLLALNPAHVFFDFSSVLFAVFFLFLPFDYWRGVREQRFQHPVLQSLRGRIRASGVRLAARVLFTTLAVILIAVYFLRLAPKTPEGSNFVQEVVRGLWVIYGAGLLAIFAFSASRVDIRSAVRGIDGLRPTSWAYLIIPLLLTLNGLTPYLGYKTEASFAMFSNLRTEGERWNHVFMPRAMQVGRYQDDLVRVLWANDEGIRLAGAKGMRVPYWQLRYLGTVNPDLAVDYERGGQVYHVARAAGDPQLPPPSWIERQLLGFRVVDPPGQRTPCRH